MTPGRIVRFAGAFLLTLIVRVLARSRPQSWCPPWLSLRLFRLSSAPGSELTAADLRRRLPQPGRTRTDLSYGAGPDARFDLALPDGPGPHPWVLWLHGGGWHFGDKADVLPYLEHLALRGFAGAAVNYPLAPGARYPAAPAAARAALDHLIAHADEYDLDPDRIVVAGDSAGAQIAGELAADLPGRFRGALLFCGIYDPAALDDADRMFEAVLGSAMWSITGSRNWQRTEACRAMSVVDRATAQFPPTFLAAGEADPLTRRQTPPLASRLGELGVDLEVFLPGAEAHHEFQFRLRTPAGAEALERAATFLERVTANSH